MTKKELQHLIDLGATPQTIKDAINGEFDNQSPYDMNRWMRWFKRFVIVWFIAMAIALFLEVLK